MDFLSSFLCRYRYALGDSYPPQINYGRRETAESRRLSMPFLSLSLPSGLFVSLSAGCPLLVPLSVSLFPSTCVSLDLLADLRLMSLPVSHNLAIPLYLCYSIACAASALTSCARHSRIYGLLSPSHGLY